METQEQLIAILVYGIVFVVLLTTGLMLFFYYSRKKITEKEMEKVELKLKNQEVVLQATIAKAKRAIIINLWKFFILFKFFVQTLI